MSFHSRSSTLVESKANIIAIVPSYEDSQATSILLKNIVLNCKKNIFVLVIDDGSLRYPVSVQHLEDAAIDGAVIHLKRNLGHQRAIAIGILYAVKNLLNAQRILVMDCDGEDSPESINILEKGLSDSEVDVCVAQRRIRHDGLKFKIFYSTYKFIFWVLTGRVINFGNFMLLTPRGAKRIAAMPEASVHLAATVLASKLRVTFCPLDRGHRYTGASKMNFVSLTVHGFKAMMIFAEEILVRVGLCCALVAALSIVGAMTVSVLKILSMATPGWASTIFGVMLLLFFQTGTLTFLTLLLSGFKKTLGEDTCDTSENIIEDITFTRGNYSSHLPSGQSAESTVVEKNR